MAVTFVIGRSGTGKTHRCFQRTVDAIRADPLGPPIYWIVPRQATFTAQRNLTCGSGLGALWRAQVLSFETLGELILGDCGGAVIPQITPLGRTMILGHLLRQNQSQLRFFSGVARHGGLAAKLDSTFAELERHGQDAAHLAESLAQIEHEPAGVALRDKLHDLHLIYTAYHAYLGQDRLDPHLRLMHILRCIEGSSIFKAAVVYVDGFTQFTEYERRILAKLGKSCERMEITLPLDPQSPVLTRPDLPPEELSLFHPVELTYRRLWHAMKEEGTPIERPAVLLTQTHRFANPSLARIETDLFAAAAPADIEPAGLELAEAPSRRLEVESAARRIAGYTAQGLRYRDICLIVRDLNAYHDLIESVFEEQRIPFFVDRRRQAAHHPLIQFLRAALAIGGQNWPHEWMIALIKCGLADIDDDQADELENYVLSHRIRGLAWESAEDWNFAAAPQHEDEEDLTPLPETLNQRADACRRKLVQRLLPLVQFIRDNESAPVRQFIQQLFAVVERFRVRQTLGTWIDRAQLAGQLEQRSEHEQVWAGFCELLDQMVDLLGDERLSLEDFTNVLQAALEQFDLALTPPAVDQVLVGQVDRTRTASAKAVLLLGLSEGMFPHVPREDSVLSDAERRELRRRNLDIDSGSARKLLDENLLGYVAFTRASQFLYVSRPIADDASKPLGPSPFWRKLRQMFPSLQPQIIPRSHDESPQLIGTPRQLITALMRWVRQGGASADANVGDVWRALYQWLATYPSDADAVGALRQAAWPALTYANNPALPDDVSKQLFASPLHASIGRMETFAACPFRHFARYALDLRPREPEQISSVDLAGVFHHVLERIVAQLLRERMGWNDLDDPRRKRMIGDYAQQIGQELRGQILLSNARNRYLLQRVQTTLEQVIANQQAIAGRGQFKPALSGVKFGDEEKLPAYRIITPAGNEVLLEGTIDRVDLIQQGGQFTVIDYRLGGGRLSLDLVYHGISLQLLTCLLVLQANSETLTGQSLTPAAAFYVRLLRQLQEVNHPSEALDSDDPLFDLRVKPRGILDAQYLSALDSELVSGRSQVVNAMVNKDGRLGAKSVTDAADSDEFAALLRHVKSRIGQLGDEIIAGRIDVSPYMAGQRSPCPSCEFRGVCRFEPGPNHYRFLPSMRRDEVLKRVAAAHRAEVPDGQ